MNDVEFVVLGRPEGNHAVWLMFPRDSRRLFIGNAETPEEARKIVNGFIEGVLYATVRIMS